MTDLSRKKERSRLVVRREPYWQRLAEGAYLGFRRGPDTWLARFRDRDGKQNFEPLGEALEYDAAKEKAEDWIATFSGSPVRKVKRGTVRAALEAYIADLKRHGRTETAKEVEGRFKQTVWSDRLADVQCESATQEDFLEWRDRLTATMQPRSVQRRVRAVAAALNKAKGELGYAGNPGAWTLTPLTDDQDESGETAVFMTAEQRRSLVGAAGQNAGDFMRALELTGARPIEIANAKVADFDGATLRLAHRKGRPPKLRIRYVVLSATGVEFFSRVAKGRAANAPLFTEDGEQPWRRHIWAREIRTARDAFNKEAAPEKRIPEAATAYSFRHSRISELLQIHRVDPLTVASQTGTSLAIIERNYFKFIPNAMREKLAAVNDAG